MQFMQKIKNKIGDTVTEATVEDVAKKVDKKLPFIKLAVTIGVGALIVATLPKPTTPNLNITVYISELTMGGIK